MGFVPYRMPVTDEEKRAESIRQIQRAIERGALLFAFEKLSRKMEEWKAHPNLMALAVEWRARSSDLAWSLGSSKATERSQQLTEIDALCRLLDRLIHANGGDSIYPWRLLPQPD